MTRLLSLCVLLMLAAAPGLAQRAAPEQGAPPTNLQRRNGYWSANDAPSSTEGFDVHVVRAGDTLWGVAGQYMGNPYLWPQVWEANPHVVNPHWIYPEDQILIRPLTAISEVLPPLPPETEPEPPRAVQLPQFQLTPEGLDLGAAEPRQIDLTPPRPVSEVKAADLYCSGFVTTQPVASGEVIAKFPPDAGVMATEGGYVYVNQGAASGVGAGDLFTAIRATRNVSSPRSEVGDLGRHYLELGQLRAVMVQPEFTLARVIHSCFEIEVGDSIMAFEEIDFPDLPTDRPFSPTMASTGKLSGAVAISRIPLVNSGSTAFDSTTIVPGARTERLRPLAGGLAAAGSIVYIDLGEADGVNPGDIFLVHRPAIYEHSLFGASAEARRLLADQRYVMGEIVVLKVAERASTALVTYSSEALVAGDSVELR